MILVRLVCDGPNCGRTCDAKLLGGYVTALVDTWVTSQTWAYCSKECQLAHRKRP